MARPLEAIPTLREAAALCDRSHSHEASGRAYVHLQWSHLLTGEFDLAIHYEGPTLESLGKASNPRLRLYAYGASSWAYSRLGRWTEAIEKGRLARVEFEASGDPGLTATAYWMSSLPHIYMGDTETAIAYGKRAYDGAVTPGERGWAQLGYAWALIPRFPEQAVELIAPLVPMWLGKWWFDAVALVALGEAYFRAGNLDRARDTLMQAVEVALPRGMLFMVAPAKRLLGDVLRDLDELDASREQFEEALRLLTRFNAVNEVALTQVGYGFLLIRMGKPDEARLRFTDAVSVFDRLGTPGEVARVRAALSE